MEADELYRTVASFIETHGGKAVVIGGVSVERQMGNREFNFRLVINFTGTPPTSDLEKSPCTP